MDHVNLALLVMGVINSPTVIEAAGGLDAHDGWVSLFSCRQKNKSGTD